MKPHWIAGFFKVALFALIVVAGFGQAVLQLWNHLMPAIFGLPIITFWQAVGLMALSWILFGGLGMFRGRPLHAGHWRHRMAERLEQMPAGERDQFLQGMKGRCGHLGAPDAPKPE